MRVPGCLPGADRLVTSPPETDPFARIARLYDGLVERYGHDVRACDYGHAASQQIKFRVLAEVTPLDRLTLLDVGCGFADYADYLHARFPSLRYTGIDLSAKMVAEARRLRPHLDLRHGNVLSEPAEEQFDVVTANGVFYLLGDRAEAVMREIVERMYLRARRAVAFNSLSRWAPDPEAGEFYADPLATLAFCRALCPWVVLRHDYHSRDFTIYMYRAARQ
jgi:predicted TPR repeat methyltransferase